MSGSSGASAKHQLCTIFPSALWDALTFQQLFKKKEKRKKKPLSLIGALNREWCEIMMSSALARGLQVKSIVPFAPLESWGQVLDPSSAARYTRLLFHAQATLLICRHLLHIM